MSTAIDVVGAPERALPIHPPGTWWWHKLDGHRTLYPRMTLEHLGEMPVTDASLFRCVHCKVEGTGAALEKTPCSSPDWYHGDIRHYRRHHTPMRCLDKDPFDGNSCACEWIASTGDPTECPTCGGRKVEEILSEVPVVVR